MKTKTHIVELSRKQLVRNPFFNKHEHVYKFENKAVGLRGFVAIHNTKLGVAVGGTRFYPYKTTRDALNDVLNLSYAMTFKCAVAGVLHGGGKAVIIGDPKKIKTKALIKAYADAIGQLKGMFYTGEDVGITESDVQLMLKTSPYFIGRSDQAGDPSEYASLSVYVVMKVAAKEVFGSEDLGARTIAIKGLGKVGRGLVKLLTKDGGRIVGADIDPGAVKKAIKINPHMKIVSTDDVLSQDVDIYAPCAMGNEFTKKNAKLIKAKIICGGANNQIVEKGVDEMLHKRGVLYVPDYLANAGGLINVVAELETNRYELTSVTKKINHLVRVFERYFSQSRKDGETLLNVIDLKLTDRINKK